MKKFRFTTPEILVIGFGSAILIGALLLMLPFSSADGKPISFLSALFTSTSAVCVTGLSVIEVGAALSTFGQVILLLLIQFGGIGFMTATSLIYFMLGRRISLRTRIAMRDSLNQDKLEGVVKMMRNVLIVTVACESVGIVLLAMRFVPEYGVSQGMYYSVFHAISAFCNAGFDVFGLGNSIIPYAGDPLVCGTIMGLIVMGGLGFVVVVELSKKVRFGRKFRFSLHTKMVLLLTGILILVGFVVFLIAESQNVLTMGNPNVPPGQKVLMALFQSVTTRTAGFASMPQADLTPLSQIMTNLLMFVGASPSGTGGGIKTTTAIMLLLLITSVLSGRGDVVVMKRRINKQIVLRAITISTLAVFFVGIMTSLVMLTEKASLTNNELSDILFEVISAFGTVGLSMNVTPTLAVGSQIFIILTMFAGRVGVFTLSLGLAERISAEKKQSVRYAEDTLMIG